MFVHVFARQTGALRLATCNLHTAAVGEGISAVLQDVAISQFIEQQEVARLGLPPPLLRRSHWLEAGSVTFNLITADVALAADHPAKYEVQRQFLELHDMKTKRFMHILYDLVFLLPNVQAVIFSVCVYMCAVDFGFFGLRRNTSEAVIAVVVLVDVVFSAARLVAWTSSAWRKSRPHQAPPSLVSVQRLTCPTANLYYIQENGSSLRKFLNSLTVSFVCGYYEADWLSSELY